MAPRTPVVFIHGLWLHATSWQPWVDLFRDHGYAATAPGWPGDADTVKEQRDNPGAVADYGIDAVAEYYATSFKSLTTTPVVVGHSFGGLLAEKLLGDGRPLLLTMGGMDHTVPEAISKSTYRKYRQSQASTQLIEFPDRGHSLTIDHGWREIAHTILAWLKDKGL